MRTFYEFFAGGGLARAGLGSGWKCLFANDVDCKKAASYRANWGDRELVAADVRTIKARDLPGCADLAWASFPCQDLSLAGGGAGLKGRRSGTFYAFWDVVEDLIEDGRAPKTVALENVCGALTSHGGQDFRAICETFRKAGYRYGAIVIDAALFVPQSRPRLFFVGVRRELDIDARLIATDPAEPFHSRSLRAACARSGATAARDWVWWNVPGPPPRNSTFADLIEDHPTRVEWRTQSETARLLTMMSSIHLAKVEQARAAGKRLVGSVYKRTRGDGSGRRLQRAEIRFDDLAGCLRTPAGGSSRQTIVVVENGELRSRLLSPVETARLMGLHEDYVLPARYNEAYHLMGDGVVVPVVRHLAHNLLEPLLHRPAPAVPHRAPAPRIESALRP